jgi:hypothetical protein
VASVEPGPRGDIDDPVVTLCPGASSDVSRLLDAVRFDDEIVPEGVDDPALEEAQAEPTEETGEEA